MNIPYGSKMIQVLRRQVWIHRDWIVPEKKKKHQRTALWQLQKVPGNQAIWKTWITVHDDFTGEPDHCENVVQQCKQQNGLFGLSENGGLSALK